MYIEKVLKMKKAIFMPIVLLLIMVIFGLNVGVTRAFAASEVYGIRQSDGWHSCDSSGGNMGSVMDYNGCQSMTIGFIGADLTSVENGISAQFTNLKKIVFMGNKVTTISNRAFWKSQVLTSAIIPESVNSIGYDVFYNCTSLTNVAIMNKGTVWSNPASPGTFDGTASNLRVYVYPANENMSYLTEHPYHKLPNKTVIAPPTDLKFDLANGVTLNWTASTDATSYKVFRADSEDGTYTMLTDTITTASYTDNTAESGKKYWYKVCSVYDTSKISNWTNGPVLESEPTIVNYDVTKIHKVTYDGNGNTTGSIPGEASYCQGDNVTVAKQGDLLKSGYSFDSWNTQQDGKGTSYKPDATITMSTEDVILYAQWREGVRYEAENANISNPSSMIETNSIGASGLSQVGSINVVGRYVEFSNLDACSNVLVRYASNVSGAISVYLNNDKIKSLSFDSTSGWSGEGKYNDLTFDFNIPQGSTLKFQYDNGDTALNIDYINIKGIPVNEINLSQNPINLTLGQTKTLTADITPSNATNQKVIWNSSDPNVAAVENGVVTPVAEGTATITATTDDETKTASCEVAVTSADCKIKYQEIQKKFNSSNNTYDISFFATIDTLDSDEAGFIFSKTKMIPVKGQVKDTNIKSTTKVYKSVTDKDSNITTAESKGGNYIIECTVERIPQEDADKPLYVRAFVVKDSKIQYTPVYVVRASEIS